IDDPLGFTRDLAAVLSDPRDPRRVKFPRHDLLKQRIIQMAAGYEDANDANTLHLLSAPLTIPLICCQINSFRRASSCGEAMAKRRKEDGRAGTASRGM